MALLEVKDLQAGYHKKSVLQNVSLRVEPGEFVGVIGHNGAGKTTMVSSIFGLLAPTSGSIHFGDQSILGNTPAENVQEGMALVPQDRAVFPNLSVRDNLELAAFYVRDKAHVAKRISEIEQLFPILKEREKQLAGTMSGGQQRMLSIGIALMQNPRLLMLDEPSLGLAPLLVQNMMEQVRNINQMGTAVLLIEQNVASALAAASRMYVMKLGRMVYDGPPEKLHDRAYLMELF